MDRAHYAHQPVRTPYPRVSVSRHLDGPDALPLGTPRDVNRPLPAGSTRIALLPEGYEFTRMHTHPHLYDEWQLEHAHALLDGTCPLGCP